ncbi:hypothetical protein [Ectothiorhodospira shaposhnikovii]|uniref:hypothetical protein n=1 Tax=Ectothiorhodospira shaposhnikovii TaxID=1054 RepID=UPI001EE8BEFC|nr:hypothetical protein [Ectothiorhodospira shaposhnikovii]MCG5512859.1 hypothetical protein [Ectothiorhodospira shaposhnikovii]
MSDTKNVKLGVCTVYFDDKDLGFTKGGVEVEVSTDTHKVTVDQFGESEVNEYIMKRTVVARVPLAETTLQNLVKIMPGAELVGSGDKLRVDVTNGVGISLLDTAKKLRLVPVGAVDSNDDFVIHRAATAGAISFAYKVNEERIFNCEFTGYPDPSTKLLFSVGDEEAA